MLIVHCAGGIDTLSGTARRHAQHLPGGPLRAGRAEGIGYDFVPTVLDREVADNWARTDDDESVSMGRG